MTYRVMILERNHMMGADATSILSNALPFVNSITI
jgi:hypothetical protein